MKIIDAHMHPFVKDENLKWYLKEETPDFDTIIKDMKRLGVVRFCGSVISRGASPEENLINSNNAALCLFDKHSDVYTPGVIIHPDYKEKSCFYIDEAKKRGINFIGELTPYVFGWKKYTDAREIIDYAGQKNMAVSVHITDNDDMAELLKMFPKINFVLAHPEEGAFFKSQIERLLEYENTYIDISGGGTYRYGTIGKLVKTIGKERILFGTDYPICNPASYVACVMYENLTDDEREHIFYKNAERLYGL